MTNSTTLPTTPTHPVRRSLRFSLRFLLTVMLLIATALGAYLCGKRVGYEQATAGQGGNVVYQSVYHVGDLVDLNQNTGVQLQRLKDDIAAKVKPSSWEGKGGSASISSFDTNLSLVVAQTSDGHDAVRNFLGGLRASRASQQRIRQLRRESN